MTMLYILFHKVNEKISKNPIQGSFKFGKFKFSETSYQISGLFILFNVAACDISEI